MSWQYGIGFIYSVGSGQLRVIHSPDGITQLVRLQVALGTVSYVGGWWIDQPPSRPSFLHIAMVTYSIIIILRPTTISDVLAEGPTSCLIAYWREPD